ncbi:nucleoporin SEH1 [Ixodes scapularis]|uniref:nucleoporin SEH1 n=1 Tax=Ixodes scapularis TaxID=6945 RepID=UPI001A9DCB97|nr:nucleoporin SEH1 [Ixodes scapularis]
MFIARSIAADHNDLVHDVAYDFYGKRLATCSSDQTVKVWDRGEDGDWHCSASWKTHSGSVWKVTWAHPEFGQVLATCSYDRMATVWEELVAGKGLNGGERGQSHWIKRTSLVDSRTSVTDVKFAPKQLGLQLATCSADGMVRVYEAPDVMNLSQWSLQSDINCRMPLSCISWNHSFNRNQPPMLAVGSDDPGSSSLGKVHVYEYCEGSRRWTRVESVVTVVEPVHDLAFAPSLGRSFFLLGIASKDVRIVSLKPLQPESTLSQLQEGTAAKFETKLVGQFEDHNSQVWRVSWNILGTILASSGDDGCVRLWKANYMGIWKCIAALQGDGCVIQGDKHAADSSSFAGNTSGPTSGYHPLIQGGHHTRVLWH